MDKYEIIAVLIPAVINSSLIILAFAPFLDFENIKQYSLESANLFVSLGGLVVVYYALIQIYMTLVQRFSKFFVEQLYFGRNGQRMPTTQYLLYGEEFGDKLLAEKIRAKVKADFNIDLLTKTKEKNNHSEAVQTILSATKLIKKQNQQANNEMYNRKNRRYGQCRNIIGGCIISIIVSLSVLGILFYNNADITFPLYAVLITLTLGLIHLLMYKRLAEEFACEFFETYLNTK